MVKKKSSKSKSKIEIAASVEILDEFGLSEGDYLFCEEYLDCMNGTQAYMELHPDASYAAARVSASRILTNANIKAYLQKRMNEAIMPKEEVLKRLKDQAEATLFPFVQIDEEDGRIYFNFRDPAARKHFHIIKKIKHHKREVVSEKGSSEENWIEVELHDAQKALELLGKYHALFADRNIYEDRRIIHVTIRKEDA